MRLVSLTLFLIFSSVILLFAQDNGLLIDDFEGAISGGPEGTVDFGAGKDSKVDVSATADIKYSGEQALKITYHIVPQGYMWVARGFGLPAKNSRWLLGPEEIDWHKYNAIAFYMYGSDSKRLVAFDIRDINDEIWRFMVEDNFQEWKQIICPFSDFFVRADWQPANADKNAKLDFPLKAFQFEPRTDGEGVFYFDAVELVNK